MQILQPNEVIIRLLDETNCAVLNLKNEHIKLLYDKYGALIESHFFNPKVKLGV
jgi:hypothetical protein